MISCKKYRDMKDSDVMDGGDLYGRLFLLDTITQRAVDVPQARKKITISYKGDTDTLNYLYSTTTDDDGHFLFSNLRKDREYIVRYSEMIDGKWYWAADTTSIPNTTFSLVAQLSYDKQPGILLQTKDEHGKIISGAQVCIFSSSIAFQGNSCDGSIFSEKTGENGVFYKGNIQSSVYYVLTTMTINGVSYSSRDTLDVAGKVVAREIIIKAEKPVVKPGIYFTTLDVKGNRLNNVQLCLFTSHDLFKRDTCEGHNYTVSTDANGKASVTNMAPGTYYVIGDYRLTNLRLAAYDTIEVSDNPVYDTLYLAEK